MSRSTGRYYIEVPILYHSDCSVRRQLKIVVYEYMYILEKLSQVYVKNKPI